MAAYTSTLRYVTGLSLAIALSLAALGCNDTRRFPPRTDAGNRDDAGTCVRSCAGRACGSDGCGGSCGSCLTGSVCNASGQCESCTPACAGRVCGDDGCGGSCGTCSIGSSCNPAGQCQAGCTPSCSGRECGSDGCGGSCGTCDSFETCTTSGVCEGLSCEWPDDCGSETAFICDPSTQRCALPECTSDSQCLSTEACLPQVEGGTSGACYRECLPRAPACGSGEECYQLDYSGEFGICLPTGSASEGSSCARTAWSTGCRAGLVCVDDGGSPRCRRECQVFGSSTCPSGQYCHPAGFCLVSDLVEDTSIGEACLTTSPTWCGLTSGRVGGVCDNSGICRQLCRLSASDCPATESCVDEFSSGDIGVCKA